MKNIIITGGSGFIGSNMIRYIKCNKLPYRVINLDYKTSSELDSDSTICTDLSNTPFELLYDQVQELLLGETVDAIIHLAGYKDLTQSYLIPNVYYDKNIEVTKTVMDLAIKLKVQTVIFSSSSAVYADELEGKVSETALTTAPSPYGFSKLVGERIVTDISKMYGINSFCLRYCNPVGGYPDLYDQSTSMFGNVFTCLKDDKEFTIFGGDYDTYDGTPIRDYIDVRDIARAHIHFIDYIDSTKTTVGQFQVNEVLNVGSGEGTSCKDVIDIVKSYYPDFKYKIGNRRPGDAAGSYADITCLTRFGFELKYSVKDVILRMANAITSLDCDAKIRVSPLYGKDYYALLQSED